MAEIRKIVIPTGPDQGERLPAPHFDAEATLSARRVVPLSEQEARQLHYDAMRAARPFWKHPAVITLVIIVAAGLGVAAGITIGNYRNRNANTAAHAQPSPAESPVQTAQQQSTPPPPPAPTPVPRATIVQDARPEAPVDPNVDESDGKGKDDDSGRNALPPPRKEPKSNSVPEEVTPPRPATRDRKPSADRDTDDDDRIFDDRQAERRRDDRWEDRRAERREERRRRREEDDNDADIPRRVQRVGDRIRGIFEGRQP